MIQLVETFLKQYLVNCELFMWCYEICTCSDAVVSWLMQRYDAFLLSFAVPPSTVTGGAFLFPTLWSLHSSPAPHLVWSWLDSKDLHRRWGWRRHRQQHQRNEYFIFFGTVLEGEVIFTTRTKLSNQSNMKTPY